MANYVVKAVQGPREWESQHGKFNSYVLTLEGLDKVVELNQKEGSPDPQIGQTLDLELSPHPKFENRMKGKKAQAFQGRGGGFGGGPRPEDPKRAAVILRQHSQEMALRYCMVWLGAGKLDVLMGEEDKLLPLVFKLADKFDEDARRVRDAG